MSRQKEKNNRRADRFLLLLSLELSCYLKPVAIVSAVFLASLVFAAIALIYEQTLATAAYATVYVSLFAVAVTVMAVPVSRTVLDVKTVPLFSDSEKIPKSPRPYAADYASARITAVLIFSLLTSFLHGATDALVTYLGGHGYDGYGLILISTSVFLFSFMFYMTAVAVAAATDYTEKAKLPRRRVVYSGVLLYALGLAILVFVVLCISTVPLGSDAIADLSESGLNPITAIWLSLIYFIVSLVRTVYLYFIIKRRQRRNLKLS